MGLDELEYDVIQEMRQKKIKMKNKIYKYIDEKHIVFVEILLDCDLEVENELGKEYLWAILEKLENNKILIKFIQNSQTISYVNETDLFDFELDDITNWCIDTI